MADVMMFVFMIVGGAVCGAGAVWGIATAGIYAWHVVDIRRRKRARANRDELRRSAFRAGYNAAKFEMENDDAQ